MREYFRWAGFVLRNAGRGFGQDCRKRMFYVASGLVSLGVASVAARETDGELRSTFLAWLTTIGVIATLLLIRNVALAPFRVYSAMVKEVSGLKAANAYRNAPYAVINQVPIVESHRFTQGAERRLTITNVGGVSGVFRAEMEPLRGAHSHWYLPWLDNSKPEWRISPRSKGTILLFAHDDVVGGKSIRYRPVRYNPDTGAIDFVPETEISRDPAVERNEFVVKILCDPPMPAPVVVFFRITKGGIQWIDGKRWRTI